MNTLNRHDVEFSACVEEIDQGKIHRYLVASEGRPISSFEALRLWQESARYRGWFTDLLASSPFAAYRWEVPAFSLATQTHPFEFVLLNEPRFVKRKADSATFGGYFCPDQNDPGIVAFPSLGKDCTLIVPSPRTVADVYGHLASFLRGAPQSQVHQLWQVIGKQIATLLGPKSCWLSTAGGGVAWLHVRLDSSPKYFGYAPYRLPGGVATEGRAP